jgi:hypothetical protein
METNKLSNNTNEQENNKQDCYSIFRKYWWILLIIVLLLIIVIYIILSKFCCKCSHISNILNDTRYLDKTVDDISKLNTSYFNKHVIDTGEHLSGNIRYINDIYNQFRFMTDSQTGLIYINKAFE